MLPSLFQPYRYVIAKNETNSSIISRITEIQRYSDFKDSKFIEQIGNDIKFHIDTLQTTPSPSLVWQLVVVKYGRLKVIQIEAEIRLKDINMISLNMTVKDVLLSQVIPLLFMKGKKSAQKLGQEGLGAYLISGEKSVIR